METPRLAFSTVHSDLGSKILNLEPCTAYVGPGSQIPDIVMKIPSPIFGIGDPRIPNPGFQFEMQLCTTERCGSLGFLGGGGMSQCCENTPSLARRLRCMRSGAPLGSAPGWARYHFHGIRTEDRSSSSSGMLGCTSSGGVHNAGTRFVFSLREHIEPRISSVREDIEPRADIEPRNSDVHEDIEPRISDLRGDIEPHTCDVREGINRVMPAAEEGGTLCITPPPLPLWTPLLVIRLCPHQ